MTEQQHDGDAPQNAKVSWERSDVRAGAILKFAVYLLLTTIAVLLLMFKLYQGFARHEASLQPPPPIMRTDPQRQPSLPRLQEKPTLDLTELRANEDAALSSYGWLDQQSGIVRIPIADAIHVVAERGLPVRNVAAPAPAPSGTAKENRK
jgi:hypothetical protein